MTRKQMCCGYIFWSQPERRGSVHADFVFYHEEIPLIAFDTDASSISRIKHHIPGVSGVARIKRRSSRTIDSHEA